MCPCYNRRTHYPTLEKHGVQNITACENQDKQCELRYHWKLKKNTFGKNNRGWCKKDKKIDWNTGFIKNVYHNSL